MEITGAKGHCGATLRYQFGNLMVDCDIELPFVEPAICRKGETADLYFTWSSEEVASLQRLTSQLEANGAIRQSRILEFGRLEFASYSLRDSVYLLWYSPSVGFRICMDERIVEVICTDPARIEFVPWLLMGVVLAFVVHLKGDLCLHASVVHHGSSGQCIGLLGTNRRGKSTLTAFLLRKGWTLVSDDLLWVDDVSRLSVHRCFPFVKLAPDSLQNLGLIGSACAKIPGTAKMAVKVDGTWGKFSTTDRLLLS